MVAKIITIPCNRCKGSGIDDNLRDAEGLPIPESCTSCEGTGRFESATIISLDTKGACPTSLILENTDNAEYLALNENKKIFYNLFISSGTLNMTVGSKAWNVILAWVFPEGTASYAAILSAVSDLED